MGGCVVMVIAARMLVALVLAASMASVPAAPVAQAQEAWPHRQVSVVVPFAAGRAPQPIPPPPAPGHPTTFGPPVRVDNAPRAGGTLRHRRCAKPPPPSHH